MKKCVLLLMVFFSVVDASRGQEQDWFMLPSNGNWYLAATFTEEYGAMNYYANYQANDRLARSGGSLFYIRETNTLFPMHNNYGYGPEGHPDMALVNLGSTTQLWIKGKAGMGDGVFGVHGNYLVTNNLGAQQDANLEDNGGTVTYIEDVPQNSFLLGEMDALMLGNIGVGTTDTKGYRLAVNGNILAKEIKVEANPWPDYVFGEDYKLPDLSELSEYIKTNRHLPGMPSAREVEADGVNLGEMNRLLLEKVEELTLYLLKERKEREQLQKTVQDLANGLNNRGNKF